MGQSRDTNFDLEKIAEMVAGKVSPQIVTVKAEVDDKNATQGLKNIENAAGRAQSTVNNLNNTLGNTGKSINSKGIQQASKTIGNSVTKTAKSVKDIISNFSNMYSTNINEKDLNQSIVKSLESQEKSINRSVNKYKKHITNIKDDANLYDAKGKKSSTLYRDDFNGVDLYNKEVVEKSSNEFITSLKESNVRINKQVEELVQTRETLYSVYEELCKKVDFEQSDFSDQNKNEQNLRNAKQLVEVAKQIDYIDSKIGTSNSKHQVDSNSVLKNFNQLADNMVSEDAISKIFSNQLDSFRKNVDVFINYLRDGLTNGFSNVDVSKYFIDAGNAAKNATKEVKTFNEELKNPNNYVNENTKLEGSAKTGWYNLNKTNPKTKSYSLSEEGQWKFVGQIANIERNGGTLNKDTDAYRYYEKLLAENEELRNFANQIMNTKVSEVSSDATKSASVNAKKLEEANKKQEKLNSLLKEAKDLDVDVGRSDGETQAQTQNIDEQIDALERLIAKKKENNQIQINEQGQITEESNGQMAFSFEEQETRQTQQSAQQVTQAEEQKKHARESSAQVAEEVANRVENANQRETQSAKEATNAMESIADSTQKAQSSSQQAQESTEHIADTMANNAQDAARQAKDAAEDAEKARQTAEAAKNDVDKYTSNNPQIKSLMSLSSDVLNNFANNKQSLDGFDDIYDYYSKKIDELNNKLLNTKDPTTKTFDTYKKNISKITKEMDNIIVGNVDIYNAQEAMQDYFNSIGVGASEIGKFNDQNKTLQATFKQDGIIHNMTLAFDEYTNSIKIVKNTTQEAETFTSKFLSGLSGRMTALMQYLLSFQSFYKIVEQLKKGVQIVTDLDTALTEMRKVSDESVESLKNFQNISFDIAHDVGTTAQQIQNSTADWMSNCPVMQ